MTLTRTIFLAVAAVGALAHPAQDARRDERLPYNPGGLMQTADSPLPYNPGGPMLPVQTTTTTTTTTSSSVPQRTPVRPGQPSSDIRDCTMHMTVSATKPICPNDHTLTMYPLTKTVTEHVDCQGCDQVSVLTTPILFCPANRITASTSVATPTTTTLTLCSPTMAYSQLTKGHAHPTRPGWGPRLKARDGAAQAACPTTVYVDPAQDTAGVSYRGVVTSTSTVACGGCPLVVATRLGGLGPLARPKPGTVVTAASTTTAYVCG